MNSIEKKHKSSLNNNNNLKANKQNFMQSIHSSQSYNQSPSKQLIQKLNQVQIINQASPSYKLQLQSQSSQGQQSINTLNCITCQNSFSITNSNNSNNSIIFYSCCFKPTCKSCYNYQKHYQLKHKKYTNNHRKNNSMQSLIIDHLNTNQNQRQQQTYQDNHYIVLDCLKKSQFSNNLQQKLHQSSCSRCLLKTNKNIYYCQQCKTTLCQNCCNHLHSKQKFVTHNQILLKSINKNFNKSQQLFCYKHKQNKTMITQNNQIVCYLCINQMKIKKYKNIKNFNNLNNLNNSQKHQILNSKFNFLTQQINIALSSHQNKYLQLKKSLDNQFQHIKALISQKYQATMITLEKYKKQDQTILALYNQDLNENKKQFQKFRQIQNSFQNINLVCQFRYFFMNQEANLLKKSLKSFENNLKLNFPSKQNIQNLFKAININKLIVKNQQYNKQNSSMKKSRISTSQSKRLLSSRKSIQTFSHYSESQKNLMINVERSVNKESKQSHKFAPTTSFLRHSKQLSQGLKTTPLRLQRFNTSRLKQNIQQDKEIKINLFSVIQNESQNENQKPQTQKGLDKIKPNYVKRKSEYLDMRDRLRKPNLLNRLTITNKAIN